MKTKTKVIIIIVLLVIILLFPVRYVYLDGGSKEYVSLLYKVIVWHRLDDFYDSGFKTGKEVHIFPNNFKSIDYYDEMDPHPSSLYLFYDEQMIKADIGSFKWCNKYNMCAYREVLLTDDMDYYKFFNVSKEDKIGYVFNDGEISYIKLYKDTFSSRLGLDIKYDKEYIYAPRLTGKYVLNVIIKNGDSESNNYFGLNIK